MCFSAEASFGAGVIIISIGVVSLKKSTSLPQKIFACIPLIFGVQQFTEGILWSSLSHPVFSHGVMPATYIFLIFAQVVWPVIAPLSIRLLEKNEARKKILNVILAIGIIDSLILGYSLITARVQSAISCHHIQYDVQYPSYLNHLGIFYFIATVISPITSGLKRVRILGYLILISYIITSLYYEKYLVSVWCYFAALISLVVLSVIMQLNRPVEDSEIAFSSQKTAGTV